MVLDCRYGTAACRITSEVGAEVPLPWTASGRDGLAAFTLSVVLSIDSDNEQHGRCLALLRDKARHLSHASTG